MKTRECYFLADTPVTLAEALKKSVEEPPFLDPFYQGTPFLVGQISCFGGTGIIPTSMIVLFQKKDNRQAFRFDSACVPVDSNRGLIQSAFLAINRIMGATHEGEVETNMKFNGGSNTAEATFEVGVMLMKNFDGRIVRRRVSGRGKDRNLIWAAVFAYIEAYEAFFKN